MVLIGVYFYFVAYDSSVRPTLWDDRSEKVCGEDLISDLSDARPLFNGGPTHFQLF